MIRSRRVSSREVVEAHIRQVERVNPTVHAVVRDRFAQARAEADRADARLAREDADALPPFHGVPCSIKESFAVEGMPWTAGLVARKDVVADFDAVTVTRLRAAGAIPIAVTNTSELCMWMESENRLYGRTSSAYDPTRTAGGSSGGEGALIGAGGSPFGLGADIGGSIRMPAFFNGVFGHKPSAGLIPNAGQFPNGEGEMLRMLGTGPLARRATDLMELVRILAGPSDDDGVCEPMPLGRAEEVDVSKLTVYDVRDRESLGLFSVERSLLDAQEKAAQALARRGARVETARLPGLRQSIALWAARMDSGAKTPYAEILGNGARVRLRDALREIPRAVRGRSPYTLPSLGLCVAERVTRRLPANMHGKSFEALRRLRDEVEAMLGTRAVMLYPSHAKVAPRHGRPMLWPVQWGYTAVFNALELPVTQVPLGLDRDGLPLGVQVVGAHGQDHLTIAVAVALEAALGGWVPPPRWS